jgi:uncharacterized membrane protein
MTRNPLWSIFPLVLAVAACDEGGSPPDPLEASPSASSTTIVASPTPSAPVAGEVEYVAGGNEPFWSVVTHAHRVVYSSPEKLDGETLDASVTTANGWTRFDARMDDAPLVLEVRKAACTDDMSGFAFSHEARITRPDGVWHGCARLASEPQPHE